MKYILVLLVLFTTCTNASALKEQKFFVSFFAPVQTKHIKWTYNSNLLELNEHRIGFVINYVW
ncbi:hypothetical protein EJP02_456 [Escherichia phage EJP2]|nr:hypothetical protein EJP02_456 [Escherichia phage EJP2]